VTALLMLSDATGAAWRVWPAAEPIAPGAVHEAGSYLFELRGSTEAPYADLLIDDVALEALRSPAATDAARWRWSPGFHAGTVEAELRVPGVPVKRFEILTDPDRRKLTRDDFGTMVREILSDTFALFSLSGFRKAVARGTGTRPPPIARLEFLRSRIDELEPIIAGIVRNPRRRLAAEEAVLPYHRASRATGPEVLRSFRSGRILKETGKPSRLPAPPTSAEIAAAVMQAKGMLVDDPQLKEIVAALALTVLRHLAKRGDVAKSGTSRDAQWALAPEP